MNNELPICDICGHGIGWWTGPDESPCCCPKERPDLVSRLRLYGSTDRPEIPNTDTYNLCYDAAEEIERLRSMIKQLVTWSDLREEAWDQDEAINQYASIRNNAVRMLDDLGMWNNDQ